jgi:MULE transposase domain
LINGDHNHPPTSDPAGHVAIRNLYKGEEFNKIVAAHKGTGMLTRHTLNVFEHEKPDIPLISRDIYNQRAACRRQLQELNGRSPIEALFEMISETTNPDMDFHCWYLTESEDVGGRLSHLFLAYKPNAQFIAHNNEVVIVDATYKTNKFKMPLVNFVGVTPNNKNFLIGTAFLPAETVGDYKFAFGSLGALYESVQQLYPNIDTMAPATILGDGDAQQIAGMEAIYPDTQYRLCIWHVNGNIQAKLLPKIKREFDLKYGNSDLESRDKERREYIGKTWETFKQKWISALQADSQATWISNWKKFQDEYESRFPSVIGYIQTSIVDKHAKRLVKCWTDRQHN